MAVDHEEIMSRVAAIAPVLETGIFVSDGRSNVAIISSVWIALSSRRRVGVV
jgi:hypothetical protein